MVELGRRPVSSSLFNRCTAEQTGEVGGVLYMYLAELLESFPACMWFSLLEKQFLLLFSTGALDTR